MSELVLQPMVHVPAMAPALAFYEALGARLVFGSRDGDWALLELAGTRFALLARPPGDGLRETVELQFACAGALEAVQARMQTANPEYVEQPVADEAFGRMLRLRAPGGLPIKIVEIDRGLVGGLG